MENVFVQSHTYPLKEIFGAKFTVGYYLREYVWCRKQLEDMIMDLSSEFMKNWRPEHTPGAIHTYHPYFMGEIVLSEKDSSTFDIIDGQQRVTTLTLLLIYLCHKFEKVDKFPKAEIQRLIYSDDCGTFKYNLEVPERRECMEALLNVGTYQPKTDDKPSVRTIVERYSEIDECWDGSINDKNANHFVYWLINKVMFSKVWTNSDEFAYVIFETMNDRGQSLTQVEMLRSYLLANVDEDNRDKAMRKFDGVVKILNDIKLSSTSKAEFEFFKVYFRGQFAENLSQAKDSHSDFIRIGKEFHRWVRDSEETLSLNSCKAFMDFIDRIEFYARVYQRIHLLMAERRADDYLYLIVNNDYGFTLQPALILASIKYLDSDEEIDRKIKIVSKHITKILSWKVWNQTTIAQSSMEAPIYELCKRIRGMKGVDLEQFFESDKTCACDLQSAPRLNQQNNRKFKVLLALITEIVARESGTGKYMLDGKSEIEIEHIWSDHFDEHTDEFTSEQDFAEVRNRIGDLLVLPKKFNASYGDDSYEKKVVHYYGQNILAQSLNARNYENNPGFLGFITRSQLGFKPYAEFKKDSITERTELYKAILKWNWRGDR